MLELLVSQVYFRVFRMNIVWRRFTFSQRWGRSGWILPESWMKHIFRLVRTAGFVACWNVNFETFQKGRCCLSSESEEVIAGGLCWLICKKLFLNFLCVALSCATLKASFRLTFNVMVHPKKLYSCSALSCEYGCSLTVAIEAIQNCVAFALTRSLMYRCARYLNYNP